MPADITGTEILQEDRDRPAALRVPPGPGLRQHVLADEINRTPPKTQAALLEAMQEQHGHGRGADPPSPEPFFVLATQNPIEQEGTYPLPEAQLDRFMFKMMVDYPSAGRGAADRGAATPATQPPSWSPAGRRGDPGSCRRWSGHVPVADHVVEYAVELVRATRPATKRSARLRQRSGWPGAPAPAPAST